jgi:hypothetical protein
MNLAEEIASFRDRGFTQEQAEVIVMMRVAAGALFRDFPESFLLYGGATLLLFHRGVRHSADLDLDLIEDASPPLEAIKETLVSGLESIADALRKNPLTIEVRGKFFVKSRSDEDLFTIDINRFGSVIKSEIESHSLSIEDDVVAVRAASRKLLLLNKAECFLLRKKTKARDAFDIYDLRSSGIALNQNLKDHLTDTLMGNEIEAEGILERVAQIDDKRCRAELESFLPSEVFQDLAQKGFQPLSDALLDLYQDWL